MNDKIIILIIFFILTLAFFAKFTYSLFRDRSKYLKVISSKRSHFLDISGNENTPITNLDESCKALALDMCAIKQKITLSYISFNNGRVELLRHPSQIIEDFSTASFKSVPAILTTIGILGTFVGITIGLSGLTDFGSDSSALVEQASTLIGGLGTAFVTSIVGMGTSFIFMVLFSWNVSNTKKAKDDLINFVRGQSVVVTSNDLLHQLVIGQTDQTRDVTQSLLDINLKLTDIKEGSINGLELLTKVVESTAGNITQISSSVSNISEKIITEQVLNSALLTQVSQPIEQLTTQVDGHALEMLAVSNKTVNAVDDLAKIASEFSEEFKKPTELLAEINEENKQINQATYALTGMLETLTATSSNISEKVITEQVLNSALLTQVSQPIEQLTTQVDGHALEMLAVSNKTVNAVDDLAKIASAFSEEFKKPTELLAEINEENKQINQATYALTGMLETLTATSSNISEKIITEQVLNSALLTQVSQPIEQLTTQVDGHALEMLAVSNKTVNAVDDLAKIASAFSEEFKKPTELLAEINEENKQINQATYALTGMLETLTATSSNISEKIITEQVLNSALLTQVSQPIEQLTTQVDGHALEMLAVSNKTVNAVDDLAKIASEFSEEFKKPTELLAEINEENKQINQATYALTGMLETLTATSSNISEKVITEQVLNSALLTQVSQPIEQLTTQVDGHALEMLAVSNKTVNAVDDLAKIASAFSEEFKKPTELLAEINEENKQINQATYALTGMLETLTATSSNISEKIITEQVLNSALLTQVSQPIEQLTTQVDGHALEMLAVSNKTVNAVDDLAKIASAFSEEFKKPTELLAEINEENKQINQATYALTGMLETLTATSSNISEKIITEQVLNSALLTQVSQPIEQLTTQVDGHALEMLAVSNKTVNAVDDLAKIASAFSEEFKKPTELLAEINEENKQINQATYALTGMLETLTATSSNISEKIITEQVLNSALLTQVSQPIEQLTTQVDGHALEMLAVSNKTVNAVDDLAKIASAFSEEFKKPTELLAEINEENKQINQATYALTGMLETLTATSSNISEKIITEQVLNSALLTQVSQPIEQLTTQVDGHALEMLAVSNKTVNAVDDLAKARADEFEGLIEKMGEEVVLPITTELANTNKVVKDFAEISNELNQSVTKTVEEMAKATATVENFELHTLEKLNEFAESMDTSLNDFADNSTAALKSITDEIQTIVELGSSSITSQTDAFSKIIQESDAIFKQQSQTMTDVGEKSAALMTTAKQELESGLGDIDAKVLSMSSTIQIELERFREEYQEKLTSYFTEQNNLLDSSLNAQRDGLNDVVDNFKAVFEGDYSKRSEMLNDLNLHHKQMVDVIERVQTMAKAFGLENASWVDTLQLQSQHVSRQVADLGLSFSKASEEFKLLSGQMRPEMDDYFKRANKSVSEYFSSFDATSSRIYTRLDSAVDLMMTVIEEANQEKQELATLKEKVS